MGKNLQSQGRPGVFTLCCAKGVWREPSPALRAAHCAPTARLLGVAEAAGRCLLACRMATLCETEEARAAREAYNLRSSAEFAPNYGSPDLHVALPCPAGVVWVDLSDLSDQGIDQSVVRGARNTVVGQPRGAEYSPIAQMPAAAAVPDPHWAPGGGRGGAHRGVIGKGGLLARGLMGRGGPGTGAPMRGPSADASRNRRSGFTRRFRRSRVNSMEETSLADGASQSSLDMDQKGRGADDEEEQVLELLNFELPPKRGAEDAKAAATRSACIREVCVRASAPAPRSRLSPRARRQPLPAPHPSIAPTPHADASHMSTQSHAYALARALAAPRRHRAVLVVARCSALARRLLGAPAHSCPLHRSTAPAPPLRRARSAAPPRPLRRSSAPAPPRPLTRCAWDANRACTA